MNPSTKSISIDPFDDSFGNISKYSRVHFLTTSISNFYNNEV